MTTRATITAESTATMGARGCAGTTEAAITTGTTVTAVLTAGTRGIPVSTGIAVTTRTPGTTIAADTLRRAVDTVGF
ncbi:hypothetical protein MSEN_39830 [Mycolicibacter senuensis]|uniref:Uncharacterized protein n=1 Tax=Mycolicibacter senuensis TaxID=386913 RepID=A0A7I9XQJ9_9MYCO|nr:hypothetical protein MSEN_39790 [Mycolicibacter senuensis]GFG72263.1 hypothetical protein MSEN_39830 [Mycolicibacter senuensis]